jgi:anti-sigma B factor antagonist
VHDAGGARVLPNRSVRGYTISKIAISADLREVYMDLRMESETKQDHILFTVHGEIDLYNVKLFKDKVNLLLDTVRVPNIILDLVDVEYIDSTGLGILIGVKRRVAEKSGELLLVLRMERILKLFSITGLSKIFDIFPTVADAEKRLSA